MAAPSVFHSTVPILMADIRNPSQKGSREHLANTPLSLSPVSTGLQKQRLPMLLIFGK